MQEIIPYSIDDETMRMCKALEFYDDNMHFPWEKKKITITVSYDSFEKLLKYPNKSKFIDNQISKTN